MSEHLLQLLQQLDELLKGESAVLDRVRALPSFGTVEELYEYEDKIDTLVAEIFAIGRYSKKHN